MVFGPGKKKLTDSPTKTRRGFFGQIMQLFGASDVSDAMWGEGADNGGGREGDGKSARVFPAMRSNFRTM